MRSSGPVTFDIHHSATKFDTRNGMTHPESSGRTIHDGFATIRASAVGHKYKRSLSSPAGVAGIRGNGSAKGASQCPGLNCGAMSPLWEEKPGDRPQPEVAPVVPRRERAQWYDIATRRSRYRSCPAFSQANILSAVEQTMTTVTDKLERLASSPDLKAAEAEELRKTAATLRRQSTAMSKSLNSGLVGLERQMSCDSVCSVSSTVSGHSAPHHHNCRRCSSGPCPNVTHRRSSPEEKADPAESNKSKKRSWLRNSFRRAFGRKRPKQSHETDTKDLPIPPFLSRLRNGSGHSPNNQELPINHCRNSAVTSLNQQTSAQLLPSYNPHLSINPNQLLDPPTDYGRGSVCSSVRNSGAYSSESGTVRDMPAYSSDAGRDPPVYSVSQTATLLRRSLKADPTESELEKEVTEKQRLLTDCQLELLSTQHQLQNKTDTLDKLQVENETLKEENSRLVSVIRQHLGSAADTVLTQSLAAMSINQQTTKGMSTLPRRGAGRCLRVQVVESVSGFHSAAAAKDQRSLETVHVGHLTVAPKTTWQQLDSSVYSVIKDFLSQVDLHHEQLPLLTSSSDDPHHLYSRIPLKASSGDYTDSSSESSGASSSAGSPFRSLLLCYRLAEVVRSPCLGMPELLPYGYCVGSVGEITVWLRGGLQSVEGEIGVRDAATVSFASNIPASTITEFAQKLHKHRRLLICGPPGCGKTRLVSTVAQHFVACTNPKASIRHFTATRTNSLELFHLLSTIARCPANQETILVLDDVHLVNGLTETLQRCLSSSLVPQITIIASASSSSCQFQQLVRNCNFCCEELSLSSEPLKGLLGRGLRRKLLCAEAASQRAIPEIRFIIDWLQRLTCKLSENMPDHPPKDLIQTTNGRQNFPPMSPAVFLDCPVHSLEDSQRWFLRVWNEKVVPVLRSMRVRSSNASSPIVSTRYTDKGAQFTSSLPKSFVDPTDWVLATYPWPPSAEYGPQHLNRLSNDAAVGASSAYASTQKQAINSSEDIYATPSVDSTSSVRTISLSSLRNYSRENGSEGAYDQTTKELSAGEGVYGYRKPQFIGERSNSSGYKGTNYQPLNKNKGKEEHVSDVPSSMALIVPYKSQNGHQGSNGYSSDLYKPLKSFGNYSQTSANGFGSQKSVTTQSLPDSKIPTTRSSEINGRRISSLTNAILEENEEPFHVDKKVVTQNGDDMSKRISRSSEEMADVEVSSSSSSASSDAIYSTIKKEQRCVSTATSEEDGEPIYFSIQQKQLPRQSRNFTVFRKKLVDDGITDSVAIICTANKRNDVKVLSKELTSTFKPVETSM